MHFCSAKVIIFKSCTIPSPIRLNCVEIIAINNMKAPIVTLAPGYDGSVSQSVDRSSLSCQLNFSETAQQNFVKLCSNEGHNEKS